MTEPLHWERSEWAEEGWSANVNGIILEVFKPTHSAVKSRHEGEWLWEVRASALRCEWPECVAFGFAWNPKEAKDKAAVHAREADATYPTINYS